MAVDLPITELIQSENINDDDVLDVQNWIEIHGGFPVLDYSTGEIYGQKNHNWSKHPEVLILQHKLAVMALRRAMNYTPPQKAIYDPRLEAEAEKQKRIDQEKRNAAEIMGIDSIYANCSLTDTVLNQQSKALEFMRLQWYSESRKNIMLAGPTGRGKTWAMVAYAATVYPAYAVNFVRAYKLSEKVNRRDFEFTNRLEKMPCVLIDDLGAEPEGFRGSDFTAFLQHLFDVRFESKRQTIFTTNLTPEQVQTNYGKPFVDRFYNSGLVEIIDDKNWREKGA